MEFVKLLGSKDPRVSDVYTRAPHLDYICPLDVIFLM